MQVLTFWPLPWPIYEDIFQKLWHEPHIFALLVIYHMRGIVLLTTEQPLPKKIWPCDDMSAATPWWDAGAGMEKQYRKNGAKHKGRWYRFRDYQKRKSLRNRCSFIRIPDAEHTTIFAVNAAADASRARAAALRSAHKKSPLPECRPKPQAKSFHPNRNGEGKFIISRLP